MLPQLEIFSELNFLGEFLFAAEINPSELRLLSLTWLTFPLNGGPVLTLQTLLLQNELLILSFQLLLSCFHVSADLLLLI